MSLTLMLIGKSSVLAANYFPAIDLSDGDYELGLAIFETYTEHERIEQQILFHQKRWKLQFPRIRTKCENK